MEKDNKKPETEGSLPDFYVAIRDNATPEEYVIDYDAQAHQPIFGTDIDFAIWSDKSNKVDTFINQNNLQGVSRTGKQGDHPTQRPPL